MKQKGHFQIGIGTGIRRLQRLSRRPENKQCLCGEQFCHFYELNWWHNNPKILKSALAARRVLRSQSTNHFGKTRHKTLSFDTPLSLEIFFLMLNMLILRKIVTITF